MAEGKWSIDPAQLLQALAEARAILFGAGEFDLADATGPLFALAADTGIDPATAHDIINRAFDGALDGSITSGP